MKTEHKKLLGKKIVRLRKNLGYSQEEVAKFLEIHRPSFTMVEKGERDLSSEELVRLCKLFNVSIESLLNLNNVNQLQANSNSSEIRVTFFRHGEAIDDVYNQYGGWGDVRLSPKGVAKSYQTAQSVKENHETYDIIYTSPLQRAREKAEILGRELNVDVQVLQYLKERNTYGLLSGLNKQVALDRYPELVELYNNGGKLPGAERYEDFQARIPLVFEHIQSSGYKNVCCITHGKILTEVMKQILGMKSDNQEDNCKLVLGIDKDKFYYISSNGITFSK